MSYNLVNPTTGALTRVSGNITSNIIPANASSSNKLVAKSDIIIKHNYSMVGTASLEDDIKTFVTALIALGANTYAGFFNRSGSLGTVGNYSITVYAEEGTSTFASGYIALGAGAMGKAQYEVSYYKPTGSSEEWKIEKLVTKSDIVDTVADGNMSPVTSNAVAKYGIRFDTSAASAIPDITNTFIKFRKNENIITMDVQDSSQTGISIDFDYGVGIIRFYKMTNGSVSDTWIFNHV